MNRNECASYRSRLVESARQFGEPDPATRLHMTVCRQCADAWEEQSDLAMDFRALGAKLSPMRSSPARRAEMLRRFDAQNPRQTLRPWWSVAAAAAVLFTVGIGVSMRYRELNHAPVSAEISEAQAEALEAGFIAVPYVPPLAPGELLHVVHTQLQPAELASFGVNVDPTLSADLPADVLVGADGFPRAVRISEEATVEGRY